MENRICCRCKAEKPAEEFAYKDKTRGTRHTVCRACIRENSRAHYQKNRTQYIGRAKARNVGERHKKRDIVLELKSRPCADCGRRYPPHVMQFDHRDPSGKVGPIANMKNAADGMPAFLAELAKCDVLCANCHCERTHLRRVGGWRDGDQGVPAPLEYSI